MGGPLELASELILAIVGKKIPPTTKKGVQNEENVT